MVATTEASSLPAKSLSLPGKYIVHYHYHHHDHYYHTHLHYYRAPSHYFQCHHCRNHRHQQQHHLHPALQVTMNIVLNTITFINILAITTYKKKKSSHNHTSLFTSARITLQALQTLVTTFITITNLIGKHQSSRPLQNHRVQSYTQQQCV